MKLILESLFVGWYVIFIYYFFTIIHLFTYIYKYTLLQLFIIGFVKHFMGYYIGIQTYYCNNGSTCNKYKIDKQVAIPFHLLLFSVIEGFMFIILFSLLSFIFNLQTFNYLILFIIGFILHIVADIIGIHKLFCYYSCKTILINK
jgi:hypothetical protein